MSIKKRNRLLALLMSVVMMVSLFAAPVSAGLLDSGDFALEAAGSEQDELLERSDIAFTVYTQVGKATKSVAKAYTKAELERMAEADSVGYLQVKGSALKVKAATEYVALEELILDALGDESDLWAAGAKLEVTCSDGVYKKGPWAGGMTYETFHSEYKWFPNLTATEDNVTGAVDAPIVLALAYGTGDVTAIAEDGREAALKSAYAGGLGILVGTTEAGLADKSASCAGNRFPSNVESVTVVVPEEKVAFEVYKKIGSEEKELIAAYTAEELQSRAMQNSVGYLQLKGSALKVKAATEYVVLEDLITDALGGESDLWAAGAKLEVTCSDGVYKKGPWAGGMTYETFHSEYKWFPNLTATEDNVTGAVDAPVVLALAYGTGDVTAIAEDGREAALKSAYAGGLGILVGTTEAGLADKSNTFAGNRFPSNVTSITVVVPEKDTVLTVYTKDETGEKTVAARYTKAELKEMAETDSVGYLQVKGSALKVKAATEYVVLEDLIIDALGDRSGYWAAGAKLEVGCSDMDPYTKGPWAGGMTYETFHSEYKWFPNLTATEDNVTGAVDAPSVLALAYGTGDVTAIAEDGREAALKSAYAGGLGILVGTTEAGLADKSASCAGNRFPSNVNSLTVTLAPKAMSYDISYVLNGATVKNKRAFITQKEYQDVIVLPEASDMVHYGYTFAGWYRDAALTKSFEDGTIGLSDKGDVTCYAKWIVSYAEPSGGTTATAVSGTTPNANTTNATVQGSEASPLNGADWKQGTDGKWNYAGLKNAWAYIVNPYAKDGKAASGWFFFDPSGNMLTGWQWILGSDGIRRCYYLNPVSDGTLGMAYINCTTPGGYTVDANGAWVKDGKVQTR